MWQEKEITRQEKWSAIGRLLLEIALLVFVVSILMLGIVSDLMAHFFFGTAWTWEGAHLDDWMFFLVLVATPLMLLGGLVWTVLREEYQRILRTRMRKW